MTMKSVAYHYLYISRGRSAIYLYYTVAYIQMMLNVHNRNVEYLCRLLADAV